MRDAVRVAGVLAVYGLGSVLLLPFLDSFQRWLILPPLFGTLARAFLVLGAVVAALAAWRYPRIGKEG